MNLRNFINMNIMNLIERIYGNNCFFFNQEMFLIFSLIVMPSLKMIASFSNKINSAGGNFVNHRKSMPTKNGVDSILKWGSLSQL